MKGDAMRIKRYTVLKNGKVDLETGVMRHAAERAKAIDGTVLVRRSAGDEGLDMFPAKFHGEWRLVTVPGKDEDCGALFRRDGTVAVDAAKYPALHRALEAGARRLRQEHAEWARIAELRHEGQAGSADRLARKLLGVQGAPMSEETKEKLRAYNEAHKAEIKQRQKQKNLLRRRTFGRSRRGGASKA
jgi:hypothetical protein